MITNINLNSVNKSNITFQYKCMFQSARRMTSIISDVMILFDDELQEMKIIILKDFDMHFYPTILERAYNDITVEDGRLIIKGRFRKKILGRYTITISDF